MGARAAAGGWVGRCGGAEWFSRLEPCSLPAIPSFSPAQPSPAGRQTNTNKLSPCFCFCFCRPLLSPAWLQGLEAVGRLRCSRGLSVEKYIGSFYRRVESDLNFPALCCDHSVAAKLAYDEKLPERGEAYLQFALLYSTVAGERRVRVHTLALPITQSLGTTFRGADLDAYMAYVGRKVASQVGATVALLGRLGQSGRSGGCQRGCLVKQ